MYVCVCVCVCVHIYNITPLPGDIFSVFSAGIVDQK